MTRIVLFAAIACLTLGGWAYAQQQELLDHIDDIHTQLMANASCPPPSGPPPGQ